MSQWPSIAFVALLLMLGLMAWARLREGSSAEFAEYTLGRKVQTVLVIYLGCLFAAAIVAGLGDMMLHGYGDGDIF